MIISRINGFTYVETQFDYGTGELKEVKRISYSNGPRAKVNVTVLTMYAKVYCSLARKCRCFHYGQLYQSDSFSTSVAVRTKERVLAGKPYFSVASGGGTGRTLHPDNMAAGPASYGMTDTMGRMHSDAQFAGSSSVPAHVEMMGFLGIGNNPMVGCTVACAVNVALLQNK